MTFEETISELRLMLGTEIAINITDKRHGPGDGYIADFSGTLLRIDDPIEPFDAPVHYFRVGDEGGGFGVHAAMFKSAEWTTFGDVRQLRVELDAVVLTIWP